MGLKEDLINGKVKAAKDNGVEDLDTSPGSFIEREAEYTKEAIINFLTQCEFRITRLNANVILEDFKIPPVVGDIESSVTAEIPAGGISTTGGPSNQVTIAPSTGILKNISNGVTTEEIDVSKDGGGLESTGYVYIGEDPDSQGGFDVSDEDGQKEFTTVKLIREDIEDLL